MAGVSTLVAPSAVDVLDARPSIRAELGDTAYRQFCALVADPTVETVLRQNSIWVRSQFEPLLNRLLRLLPDQADAWLRALKAIGAAPKPLRVPPTPITECPYDTLEERRGLV